MFRTNITRLLATLVLFCAIAIRPASALTVNVIPITGQLLVGGSPVTGNYDLQFQLYTAATGGTTVGPLVTVTNVAVADGVFYAEVNFGALSLGNPLYLQTSYRTAGTGSYTVLTPRHTVPSVVYAAYTPYASFAGNTNTIAGQHIKTTVPTNGQALIFTGGYWTPTTLPTGGTYTAGNGLTLTGNQFAVAVPLTLTGSTSDTTLMVSNSSVGGAINASSSFTAISASSSGSYGVQGSTYSSSYAGVEGFSGNNDYGFLGGTDPQYSAPAGVFGQDAGSGNGVFGFSSGGTGSGVAGVSDGGIGVLGNSTGSDGVQGNSANASHSGVSGVNTVAGGMGVYGINRSSGDYGFIGGTDPIYGNSVAVFGKDASSSGGSALFGYSQNGSGVFAYSSSRSGYGVQATNSSNSTFGFIGGTDPKYNAPTGVFGTNTTSSGNGVFGLGTNSTGTAGVSTNGYGVFGQSTGSDGVQGNSASSTHSGVAGLNSGGGNGVYGGSNTGYAVYGNATSGVGVYAVASSTSGTALSAHNTASGDYGLLGGVDPLYGISAGVVGADVNGNGWGVFGINKGGGSAVYGTSDNGIGIHGASVGGFAADFDGNIEVHGHSNSNNIPAAYFSGNVTVTGSVSKAGGSFKIDHPLDPEHKYLYHSFVESPDMMNIYNGSVVLDRSGDATVTMPDWFEALNQDFQYQLTCVGGFAPVYIAKEITDNTFHIAGGKPGLKVSWQVTGIRHDAWANAHRIPTEEDKPAQEQGTYLHPKEWGQPEERGVDYARTQKVQSKN